MGVDDFQHCFKNESTGLGLLVLIRHRSCSCGIASIVGCKEIDCGAHL